MPITRVVSRILGVIALLLVALAAAPEQPRTSSWWLGALPDGEDKRKFILDCTGCHQFNETRVYKDDALREESKWNEDVARMLTYAGAESGFPVIAADRDPEKTAAWLAKHLASSRDGAKAAIERRALKPSAAAKKADVREYDLPIAQDLPHDVAIDSSGAILVTGMFAHVMYKLDPESGEVENLPIPVDKANPRAIEIDTHGNWWVLLGQPKKVARYSPADDEWKSWDIGMYPHSVAVSEDGSRVWFNGHFSKDPEQIGRLDIASESVEVFDVPSHPTLAKSGGPVPYEQRIAPDGSVWISELQGNRIVRFDPEDGTFKAYSLPTSWSGPRRFDIDAEGRLWIPAYSNNQLLRFDPESEAFTEYDMPASDALPYIARVDHRTGMIWIGSAAADAAFRFDPQRERFDAFALPTRGATVRHLVIDPRNGDVWLAFGASPAIHPARVARLRVGG